MAYLEIRGLHVRGEGDVAKAKYLDAMNKAELLALPVGAPVMYIEQIVYLEDGTPAECSDIWLRGDRFKLSSLITRDGKQTMTHAPNGE